MLEPERPQQGRYGYAALLQALPAPTRSGRRKALGTATVVVAAVMAALAVLMLTTRRQAVLRNDLPRSSRSRAFLENSWWGRQEEPGQQPQQGSPPLPLISVWEVPGANKLFPLPPGWQITILGKVPISHSGVLNVTDSSVSIVWNVKLADDGASNEGPQKFVDGAPADFK
ncbi:unnamed protein product, partial [Polarella glacialis]